MPEPVAQPQPVPASGRREQPRGRLRAAQREFTRARIVEAAIEVFAEKGYARTTVDDIASRAGSTRATFYLHFRAKSEILTDLMARSEEHYHRIYQQLSAVVAEPPTLPGVRTWLSLAMSEWRSIGRLSRPVHEAAAIEPEVSELNSARYNAQITELAQALRGGAPHGPGGQRPHPAPQHPPDPERGAGAGGRPPPPPPRRRRGLRQHPPGP